MTDLAKITHDNLHWATWHADCPYCDYHGDMIPHSGWLASYA